MAKFFVGGCKITMRYITESLRSVGKKLEIQYLILAILPLSHPLCTSMIRVNINFTVYGVYKVYPTSRISFTQSRSINEHY